MGEYLQEQCVFKDGELEGEYKDWWDNGQLNTNCTYKNNIRDGKYQKWNKSGNLIADCILNKGKCGCETRQKKTKKIIA